jgi:spore germination protein GerM
MSRRVLALAAVAALLVAASALGGCGVGTQAEAQRLPKSQVPFDLLSPGQTTRSRNGFPQTVVLFLLGKGHLVAVTRQVPAPATFDARLSVLAAGPTKTEAAHGLSSAVSGQGSVPTGTVKGNHATIKLAADFEQLNTQNQVEALAQLVYTATAIPGVAIVSFVIGSTVVAVPRGDNTTSAVPVTRADYKILAPLPAS